MKSLHEALAELARQHGIELAEAELLAKDGARHHVEMPDTEAPPGSPWTFTKSTARYRGKDFAISGKKLLILRALAFAAGEPVAKVDLFRAGWGIDTPDELNFHSTIYQLRQLLMRELRPDRDPIENAVGAFVLTLA